MLTPVIIIVCNNRIAKSVEKNLLKTPIPNNTEIIDSISVAGKLTGNGNGMQYFGAILLKTDLNENEIIAHYDKYKKNEWSYLIKEQKKSEIDVIEHGDYKFKNISKNEENQYYIVYSWGEQKNKMLLEMDLRAH